MTLIELNGFSFWFVQVIEAPVKEKVKDSSNTPQPAVVTPSKAAETDV